MNDRCFQAPGSCAVSSPRQLLSAHVPAAEVYGFGKSEEFLRDFMTESSNRPIVATKFAPLPWRQTAGAVPAACKKSLERLGMQKMALYIQVRGCRRAWCAASHARPGSVTCSCHRPPQRSTGLGSF